MSASAFRQALERIGISQLRLAALLHRDKMTVNRWARGHAPIPHETWLILAILDQTDLTVEDLEALPGAE